MELGTRPAPYRFPKPITPNWRNHMQKLVNTLNDAAQEIITLMDAHPDTNDHLSLASDKLSEAIDHLTTADCYIDDKPTTVAWNTGAPYSAGGQKLAAKLVTLNDTRYVAFVDVTRDIQGEIETELDIPTDAELKRVVRFFYDDGNYKPILPKHVSTELVELAEAVADVDAFAKN